MAKRPVFFVQQSSSLELPAVEVVLVDFDWYPGMAISQKQKSIDSLHYAVKKKRPCRILEISSKSPSELGIKLSAFNLGFTHPKSKKFLSVESAFQGSKIFELSGPFHELYTKSANEAKKFFHDKKLGALVGFDLYGQHWPIKPMTIFYDWLYLNSVSKNPAVAKQVLEYDCFTDIEFNPKKSVNCQAYSVALFVSLSRRGLLKQVLEDRNKFIDMLRDYPDWIESTEYATCHQDVQKKLFEN
ncbi:MAG TPA: hypothetical protein PLK90_08710 [Clostridiales bacterium]|nr:hypothetical protein [Clostridiales bacterium]HQP70464.1 hypothetical protein [Clostridiales bacterium]